MRYEPQHSIAVGVTVTPTYGDGNGHLADIGGIGSMFYRRAKVAGGTYFFTVNLAERNRNLLVEQVDLLRTVVQKVKSTHRFQIDAMVILPDHLHAVWTLPVGDEDYATRWMLIKAGFSRQIAKGERRKQSRLAKGERRVWQRPAVLGTLDPG